LECEYGGIDAGGGGGGVLKPLQAKTSAGGTVTLPTLKTHREIEMVLTIAPSGSGSEARDATAAWSTSSIPPLTLDVEGVSPFDEGDIVASTVALKRAPVPSLTEGGD
jgi:hypothetical protein